MWTALRDRLSEATAFKYYPFSERILSLFHTTKAKEIYDKIIILTTKAVKDEALITKDKDLIETHETCIIWW